MLSLKPLKKISCSSMHTRLALTSYRGLRLYKRYTSHSMMH